MCGDDHECARDVLLVDVAANAMRLLVVGDVVEGDTLYFAGE